jgi:(p)ppGpp synthase/HD superfamily hydrolase
VLQVMLRQKDEAARLAAVLHDTVEDTPTTLADLRSAGYSEEIWRGRSSRLNAPRGPNRTRK